MMWLPRNLPERGALRYLLHRGRERVIPGTLNLPHPAGASRPGQPGANPQANTLNLRKNADHRPGVEYRTNANADDGHGLVWTAFGRHRNDPACGGLGPTAPDQVPADGPGTRDPVQGQQTQQGPVPGGRSPMVQNPPPPPGADANRRFICYRRGPTGSERPSALRSPSQWASNRLCRTLRVCEYLASVRLLTGRMLPLNTVAGRPSCRLVRQAALPAVAVQAVHKK